MSHKWQGGKCHEEIYCLFLVVLLCFVTSAGVFAEETYDTSEETYAVDVIVDADNNTIEFIFGNNSYQGDGAFNDVKGNAWYNMFVSYLKQTGVINGISEKEFAPDQAITRSEFVKMISMLSGDNVREYHTLSFSDSNNKNWYYNYAEWSARNGVVEGDEKGDFNGTDVLTREEAITMLYRYADNHENHIYDLNNITEDVNYIDDSRISDWSADAVSEMSKAGVIQGYENEFAPKEYLTRASAAKIIAMFDIYNKRPTILSEGSLPLEYEGEKIEISDDANDTFSEIDTGFAYDLICVDDDGNIIDNRSSKEKPIENETTLSWKKDNHPSMLEKSFAILAYDNNHGITPVYVHNLSSGNNLIGKISDKAQNYISSGSVYPDEKEKDYGYVYHYYKYNSDLENGIGTTKPNSYGVTTTAYHMYSSHYYNAKMEYAAAHYVTAYKELGKSIHYLQDMNCPVHANLITGNPHFNYESWVKNNFYSVYNATSAPGTYAFICNHTFRYMSNSFSKYACEQYPACMSYSNTTTFNSAKSATAKVTTRAQRATAGLLYRFLVDTGRAN